MVRNPRTLMVCSLLALATGMALGSWLAPSADGTPPRASFAPALADRLAAWQGQAWTRVDPAVDALRVNAVPVEADAPTPATGGIEGERQPRMPRMSRETLARAAR